jgi:hypothetical protein
MNTLCQMIFNIVFFLMCQKSLDNSIPTHCKLSKLQCTQKYKVIGPASGETQKCGRVTLVDAIINLFVDCRLFIY